MSMVRTGWIALALLLCGSGASFAVSPQQVAAGINFAIPVSRLQKLLSAPMVVIDVPTIEYARRSEEHPFVIKVVSLVKPAVQDGLELSVHAEGGVSRTYTGTTVGGACTLNVVPVPRGGDSKLIAFSAKFSGESTVLLSAVRSIEHPARAR